MEYTFSRGSGTRDKFHIIAVSDVHLGTIIGKKHFDVLLGQIARLKPDIVLFVGDTIDEDVEPVIKQDIGSSIRKLHAPYGVFAVNGNHEHMGGVELADKYLTEHGVKVLRDESVVVDESFTLVGREDAISNLF